MLLDYNRLMKLPIILYSLFFALREVLHLREFLLYNPIEMTLPCLAMIGSRIALILFLLLLALMSAKRMPPIEKARGLQPRISALLGMSLMLLLLLLDRPPSIAWLDLLSTFMLLLGNFLCIITLLHLGRSLSVMAEARQLVTVGPYALIRHPLNFCEEIAFIGLFLQFRTWEAASILVVHFAFQIQRMLNEEKVLLATFPEYGDYMRRTSRLIPGVW